LILRQFYQLSIKKSMADIIKIWLVLQIKKNAKKIVTVNYKLIYI